jgi:branched-chain amino acid transport system ATP-binding protein
LAASALAIEDIWAGYGSGAVLSKASFAVDEGRTLALLGRNGVGKSTCMKVIMGFLAPSAGEVRLFGEPITRLGPERIARRGVGIVPQGRRTFKSLTVEETLTFAARPGPWSVDRVYDEFPRLRERRTIGAGNLSGGEQQMLAIGRALTTNPRVLLLDEPTEGLSPLMVRELDGFLRRLRGSGMTTVLVEQNVKLALAVADDAIVLGTGRIGFRGTAEDLIARQDVLDSELGVG